MTERPRRFPDWAYESPYTHLATVRGHRDVPVRRDGRFWVCAVQIDHGYYWSGREVHDAQPID